MTNDVRKIIEEFRDSIASLRSSNMAIRDSAWGKIQYLATRFRAINARVIDLLDYQHILEAIAREDTVASRVDRTLVLMSLQPYLRLPDPLVETTNHNDLGTWFWERLQTNPLFLKLFTSNHLKRDEAATALIQDYLRQPGFSGSRLEEFTIGKSRLDEILASEPKTRIIFLGRPLLFGDSASEWFAGERRFSFPERELSGRKDPDSNEIDPKYHQIREQIGPDGYVTYVCVDDERTGMRTDYGIVQRFAVPVRGQVYVVYVIAGTTRLGTYAAAQWATNTLIDAVHFNDSRIQQPADITDASTMEALIKVTHSSDENTPLGSCKPELMKLIVDNHSWDSNDLSWHPMPPRLITLVFQEGKPDFPTSILFDGKESKLNPSNQKFRVLAKICMAQFKNPSLGASLKELLEDNWIWEKEKASDYKLRSQFSTIRRHVDDALILKDEHVRLDESIRIELEHSTSSSQSSAKKPSKRKTSKKSAN